jgi:hypothetical protein
LWFFVVSSLLHFSAGEVLAGAFLSVTNTVLFPAKTSTQKDNNNNNKQQQTAATHKHNQKQ